MDLSKLLSSISENLPFIKDIEPLISLFAENNFNFSETLKNLDIGKILPILFSFADNKKPSNFEFDSKPDGLAPIANVADKEIIYTLNKYFS